MPNSETGNNHVAEKETKSKKKRRKKRRPRPENGVTPNVTPDNNHASSKANGYKITTDDLNLIEDVPSILQATPITNTNGSNIENSTGKPIRKKTSAKWCAVTKQAISREWSSDRLDLLQTSGSSPMLGSSLLEDIIQGNLDNWDPEACVVLLKMPSVNNFSGIKKLISQSSAEWTEEFLSLDGLEALFEATKRISGKRYHSITDAVLQLECVFCIKALLNSVAGLDYITSEKKYSKKLGQVLHTNNVLVKKQVFELLSAISVYSKKGYELALCTLDNYKIFHGIRFRFEFIISELSNADVCQYEASILAFVNCLIFGEPKLLKRCALRNELIGLELLKIVEDLRGSPNDDVVLQVKSFEDAYLEDVELLASIYPTANNHYDAFNSIFTKVQNSPNCYKLLALLQNLDSLEQDSKHSDEIWKDIENISLVALNNRRNSTVFKSKLMKATINSIGTQTFNKYETFDSGSTSVVPPDNTCDLSNGLFLQDSETCRSKAAISEKRASESKVTASNIQFEASSVIPTLPPLSTSTDSPLSPSSLLKPAVITPTTPLPAPIGISPLSQLFESSGSLLFSPLPDSLDIPLQDLSNSIVIPPPPPLPKSRNIPPLHNLSVVSPASLPSSRDNHSPPLCTSTISPPYLCNSGDIPLPPPLPKLSYTPIPPPLPHLPNSTSIPPPPPLPHLLNATSIPPPPQLPNSIGIHPPLPVSTGIPPPPPLPNIFGIPPPPLTTTGVPPPPPIPNSTSMRSLINPSNIPFPPSVPNADYIQAGVVSGSAHQNHTTVPFTPTYNQLISSALISLSGPVIIQLFCARIPRPSMKTKRINWGKINPHAISNSVWSEIISQFDDFAPLDVNYPEMEQLFCQNLPSKAKLEPVRPKNTKESFLDAKTSLNISIFLKQFKSTPEDVSSFIRDVKVDCIGGDKLRALLKILPEKNEVESIQRYVGDVAQLSTPDIFLYHVYKIPFHDVLIKGMILKAEFEPSALLIGQNLKSLLQICQAILQNASIKYFLAHALTLGNFLNTGSYAGNAAGFKLNSITKLWETRANKAGVTFLHYVVNSTTTHSNEMLDFVDELKEVLGVTIRLSVDGTKTEFEDLRREYQLVNKIIRSTASGYLSHFEDFLSNAEMEIESLEGKSKELEVLRMKLAKYFCEDEAKFRIEDCIRTFHMLCSKVQLAIKENIEGKKRDERRRQIEAQRKKEECSNGNIGMKKYRKKIPIVAEVSVIDSLLNEIKKGNFKLRTISSSSE